MTLISREIKVRRMGLHSVQILPLGMQKISREANLHQPIFGWSLDCIFFNSLYISFWILSSLDTLCFDVKGLGPRDLAFISYGAEVHILCKAFVSTVDVWPRLSDPCKHIFLWDGGFNIFLPWHWSNEDEILIFQLEWTSPRTKENVSKFTLVKEGSILLKR